MYFVGKITKVSREINQARHEQIIDFLNKFDQYKGNFKKVERERNSDKFHLIDTNEINRAVVVLTNVLNLSGGSVSDVDLYELLQAYLQEPSYRERFNELVSEAKGRDFGHNV